jgi:diguanylate cyclase (GGDEF)-like protein
MLPPVRGLDAVTQFDVFSFSAAVTALLLVIGFMVAYAINRRLTGFRWWAASFVLLALWLATLNLRIEGAAPAIKWLSWGSLYAAACIVAIGLHREGAARSNPLRRILICGLLFLGVATALSVLRAPQPYWILLGSLPTVVFLAWSSVLMLRAGAWGYALALYAGLGAILVRALWHPAGIARAFAPPPGPAALRSGFLPGPNPGQPLGPAGARPGPGSGFIDFTPPPAVRPPVEHALTVMIITIVALLVLAVALVLRDIMAEIDRMRHRSSTDAMTGLLNRATFEEAASTQLRAAGDSPACLVLFDIDHFKRINDTAGHAAGDRVIERLGQLVGEMNLIQSIAGRVGGEEFAVLLPGGDINTARLYAEAIRTGLATSDFGDEIGWGVTLSAGIARHRPGESLAGLTARADKALYAAKAGGRDRVTVEEGPAPAAMRRAYGT